MDNTILRNLSYGVYIVSTHDNGRLTGCVANSAMQVTSKPATIAVSINHDNYTNQCIQKSGYFSLSVLSEKSDPSIIGTFGFQSGKDTHKFATVDYEMVGKVPAIKDSVGYIVCKVVNKFETSTHTIFLGEMTDGGVYNQETPMTYSYYHNVVKGKSPKNAPTYIEEVENTEKKSDKKYKCTVCGYIYEGEELPEGYTCPICSVDADKFEEM